LLDDERPADVVAPRALEAEARHADQDDVRLDLTEPRLVEAEILHDARREILEDDVGARREPAEEGAPLLARQVERQAALPEIRGLEGRAVLVVVLAELREGLSETVAV